MTGQRIPQSRMISLKILTIAAFMITVKETSVLRIKPLQKILPELSKERSN